MSYEFLVKKFERIVILKTILFDIDLNFIDKGDLDKIALYANEMEIDINYLLYDELDYPTNEEMIVVYEEWQDDIWNMFLEVKDDLLKVLNG